jgi:hypothetical protein
MAQPRSAPPPVDARAVRLSQGVTAALVGLAAALGAWPLLAIPALHLAASASLGPRGNLVGGAFCRFIRPRLATEAPEDPRGPRFAAAIGTTFLAASLAAHALGFARVGWALAAAVAVLATLAAATGLCVGCKLYWLVALARRVRLGAG